MKTIIEIEGICCKGCVKNIAQVIKTICYGARIKVSQKTNNAVINSKTEIDANKLTRAIEDEGFLIKSIVTTN